MSFLVYNIPTGGTPITPNDYPVNDNGGVTEMKAGRPSQYMQPPSPWVNQRAPLSVDVNVAYVEGREEVDRGAPPQPMTQFQVLHNKCPAPWNVTGNDFSTLYAPLIRDGRMEKFYWATTRDDRIGVCTGIFRSDNIPDEDIVKLVDTFPGQSIDFFGALRARVDDGEVRKWISGVGVDSIGKKLVNSKEDPPTFEQPKMTLEKLLEYGNMLVQEQENVRRVQLADKYMSEAALGEANEDAIKSGTFYGKAAQEVKIPVPEGCTDPSATNFDPTARSDNGSCQY